MKRLLLVLSTIILFVNIIGCTTVSDTTNAFATNQNLIINSSTPTIVQSATLNSSDSITLEPSEIPASAPENKKTSEVSPTAEVGTIVAASDDNTIKIDKKTSAIKEQAPPNESETSNTDSSVIKATAEKTREETEKKEVTIYVTKTGEKYHSNGCQYLRKSKIPISLDNAKDQGYTPCSRCNPPV